MSSLLWPHCAAFDCLDPRRLGAEGTPLSSEDGTLTPDAPNFLEIRLILSLTRYPRYGTYVIHEGVLL